MQNFIAQSMRRAGLAPKNKGDVSSISPTNKAIHWVCVPVITFTLLGLLSLVNYSFIINNGNYNINLASVLIIIAILFYLRLSISLSIGMIIFTGVCMHFITTFSDEP